MAQLLRAFRRLLSAIEGLIGLTWEKRLQKRLLFRRSRFSRPAMVILESGDRLFACSRNISKRGIGLSHEHALPLGKLRIHVDLDGGRYMQICAKIRW